MPVHAARAQALFLAASGLADAAERAAYLERECGTDAELRGRVESLLLVKAAAPSSPVGKGEATVDSNVGALKHGGTGEFTPQPAESPACSTAG
jgi:uncharacterized membrane protein